MNALDSPLEVLSFSSVHLSPLFAAAFSNLWALLAVVAAAAMFHLRRPKPPKPAPSNTTDSRAAVAAQPTTTSLQEAGKCISSHNKEVFTVHYHVDDVHVEYEDDYVFNSGDYYEDEEDDEGEAVTLTMFDKLWESDDKWSVVETRGGEFGWYDYQDIEVIDGSVVRLWSGERRSSRSPRGCCSRRTSPRCCSLGVTPFSFGLEEMR
ncbi:hypothetical protein vseg_000662 [Gypsophila vaccaria]